MAKRKSVKRAKKVVRRAKVVRRVAVKPAGKRLNILLILLALAVFVLAAVTMTKGGV
jgi:hypothetical protein